MKRFENQTAALHIAIGLSLALVFLADLNTQLGIAVWVFYLVPIVFSYRGWRPQLPLLVSTCATVLVVSGYWFSPTGIDLMTARFNRGFLIATIWALGVIGYKFIRNKVAVRKQDWLQSGQTTLSERMAGDPQPRVLGEHILGFFAEYLDARAGAIFMEEGGIYRRAATYGVPEGARIPGEVRLGEGLLGAAAKENRVLVVREVPEGYLTIGSALGRSSPLHLLIVPVAVDRKVHAVVELGFFTAIGVSEIELFARVSESIGVAIRSAYYRNQLRELLEQTQQQAEELQAQSEELRVTNEELEEQSRALKESQAQLEEQQAELEQTNSQLHQQTRMLEAQNDELSRAKQSLERQARELEQASSYKSAFLANMSHELRTPLNSSLILARLLADNRENNLTEEQVNYAKTIESAGNDLLALINDVLDLAKVEAGHIEVRAQRVRLPDFIEGLRNTFLPMAEEKGLRLEMKVAAEAPETLFTDPRRLEQVLRNLLSNAIKFTGKGVVTLGVSRAQDGRVAMAVTDTGIGIEEDQQQVIFEPFRQADGSTSRKYGGTGLGLSISRELVRLLGGELQLASVAGQGSTFTVLLPEWHDPAAVNPELPPPSLTPALIPPLAPPAPNARAALHIPDDREQLSGSGRVLLIVEDDETFAGILGDLARELGFKALIAPTADEAVALAAQHKPCAVVLDIGLPDHSGLAVLDRLKTDRRTRHIPVHVVSASDYAETAYSMGAAGYMLKPVHREQLMAALQKLEYRATQKLRRVLIVEDNSVQRESISRLLASEDVEIVGASSAAECLERLSAGTFDCMVLDLSLPDGSGLGLLETLSREDKYSFPPVIVYTGRELAPEEEQRLRRYSKSIIIKGAKSPERLLDEVTLFLHQVISDLPAEQRLLVEKSLSRDATMEGREILIVEDDVRNVFALTSLLERQGAKLRIARNGREALEMLDRSVKPDGTPVDLVLMDLMMPEMDGLTAIREIRKRPQWKKLPILALTAKAMRNDQEEAIAAGANDYMAKPLDPGKLLSLVRVWMPR
jgi:signal transduction histidine kinase/DNA-binding response OmpR family regulator